jgi:hypothetical protein
VEDEISDMNTSMARGDHEWIRKFGNESVFAIETTVLFGETSDEPPSVRQNAWVGGIELKSSRWYEFKELCYQTASVAQFNGQRRSRDLYDLDAKTAFDMIWSAILDDDDKYFLDCSTADRLTPRLAPFFDNHYGAVIGSIDYGLRFLLSEDRYFSVNPLEVEMSLADFEAPLAETMKFLESVARIQNYDWRDVLWDNYRAHW